MATHGVAPPRCRYTAAAVGIDACDIGSLVDPLGEVVD